MDYFLKTFSLQKEREGRVKQFFSNQITPLINSSNKHAIDLEIGCGHGHWINEYAQRNKSKICIGIDLISKRIEKATVKKENAKKLKKKMIYQMNSILLSSYRTHLCHNIANPCRV